MKDLQTFLPVLPFLFLLLFAIHKISADRRKRKQENAQRTIDDAAETLREWGGGQRGHDREGR